MDPGDLDHREEVDREFRETRANPSAFLQPADRLRDDAATPVGPPVEDGSVVTPALLDFLARDQRLEAVLSKPVAHPAFAVALAAHQSLRQLAWASLHLWDQDLVHPRLNVRRLVHLAGAP